MVARSRKDVAKTSKKSGSDSIDIYVRMNEDPTKDYCFSVKTNTKVSSLFKIFDTLPVQLNPSYFFKPKPRGFAVSVNPGYLTAEGALLFTDKAHKNQWIKEISNEDLIGDVVVEGQLVVPLWEPWMRRKIGVITTLLVWLYLDLPEFISPTPGTAPSKFLYWLFEELVMPLPPPTEDDLFFNNVWFQLLFFAFHLTKVGILYLILWNGLWQPKSLNPFSSKRRQRVVVPKREALTELGWTSARRLTPDSWEDKYHEYRTQRAGGVVEAYRSGELMKPMGFELKEGEGWNALEHKDIKDIDVDKDLLDQDRKFVVSRPYFLELAKPLSKQIITNSSSSDDALELIKDFRTFGYLDGPAKLRELFTELIPQHKRN